MKYYLPIMFLFITWSAVAQKVVINEILSANDRIIRDPVGDFDDYIELFNPTGTDIKIGGFFITDNKDSLKKCRIADGIVLNAGAYLLVWIDGEMEQEGVHCPFKLNSKGERIILSDPLFNKLDEVNLPRQFSDVSYGRIPNASGNWVYLPASPAAANAPGRVLGLDRSKRGEKMKVKVAPSKDKLLVELDKPGKLAYRVMDKESKIFLKGTIETKGEIALNILSDGRYLLVIGKTEYRILKQN